MNPREEWQAHRDECRQCRAAHTAWERCETGARLSLLARAWVRRSYKRARWDDRAGRVF